MRIAIVLLCLLVSGIAVQARPVMTGPQTQAADTKAAVVSPLNLNTATVEQLQKLPGVGPKTAARILDYRQKNGAFKKVEELMNVKGVGEKSFLRLKSQITVTPPKSDNP
jgi:competence protein ComEA